MNTSEFLANLTQQGIQLWDHEGKLRIHSPKGLLTPELQSDIATRKADILALLEENKKKSKDTSIKKDGELSLSTIGRLISGFSPKTSAHVRQPIIDPLVMAKQLKVTFRPLPHRYQQESVLQFREELERQLRDYGVQVEPWHEATRLLRYDIKLPFIPWKKSGKALVVKADINAVIDVERPPSLRVKAESFAAEKFYQFYDRFILKHRNLSPATIAFLIGWAEDHAAQRVEDPNNTQVIILKPLDEAFSNPDLPYQQKIPIGINTLVSTFSEMVIGVSEEQISILNMNLSDSLFSRAEFPQFVLKSLIPKIFVPIAPLPISRFQLGTYNPHQSTAANTLVKLGKALASTDLLPPGFQLSEVIKRKSHRDLVEIIVNGRTGVSYGFVAHLEPPQYVGAPQITEQEWNTLSAIEGFNEDEVRQNEKGRRYLKLTKGTEQVYQQIPDIWLVSSRSGSNKTDLNLETDVLRIGLKERLLLEFPEGIDATSKEIKPSYDIYVMVAIALSAALYTPELMQNGASIVHFHGYPALNWFKGDEYCVGIDNPSVPCGTYESGVFNFRGIYRLSHLTHLSVANGTGAPVRQAKLVGLIEPDHGTNIIAPDWHYLVERLQNGCQKGEIELGGKHYASLKAISLSSSERKEKNLIGSNCANL